MTQPFTLVTPDAERKFVAGDVIGGEVAAHWYAQAHSEPIAEAEAKAEKPSARKAKP